MVRLSGKWASKVYAQFGGLSLAKMESSTGALVICHELSDLHSITEGLRAVQLLLVSYK